MKKILVALMVLALAGGAAFAQGWTFSGLVDGGLAVVIADDADDPAVTVVSREQNAGVRTWLQGNFVNADATGGLNFRLRAQNITADNATDAHVQFAFGWLSFMDGMVTVNGGLVDNGFFNSLDRMMADDSGEGVGLFTVVRPMDNLHIGIGAFTRGDSWLDDSHAGDNVHPQGSISLSYLEPDTFRITAGFRNRAGGPQGGAPYYAFPLWRTSQAYLSFSFLGAPGMHAAVTARFQNLEDFGDAGDMRFYATFAHTGLVENMGLHLGASFGMTMADYIALGVESAPHVWVWAAVDYALSDVVVPRLDLHYVMGGRIQEANANSLHNNIIRDGVTFNEDHSFFRIQPSVQFRVAPANAFVEIGCIFHVNIGDAGTWISADNTDIALYALLRVQF